MRSAPRQSSWDRWTNRLGGVAVSALYSSLVWFGAVPAWRQGDFDKFGSSWYTGIFTFGALGVGVSCMLFFLFGTDSAIENILVQVNRRNRR